MFVAFLTFSAQRAERLLSPPFYDFSARSAEKIFWAISFGAKRRKKSLDPFISAWRAERYFWAPFLVFEVFHSFNDFWPLLFSSFFMVLVKQLFFTALSASLLRCITATPVFAHAPACVRAGAFVCFLQHLHLFSAGRVSA